MGPFHFRHPFWTLLAISFLLRSATVLFFIPRFREVRDVPQIGVVEMIYSTTRDTAGSAVNLMSSLVQRGGRES